MVASKPSRTAILTGLWSISAGCGERHDGSVEQCVSECRDAVTTADQPDRRSGIHRADGGGH